MNFKISYIVYPVRQKCTITLTSVFPVEINPDKKYTIKIRAFSGFRKYGLRNSGHAPTDDDIRFFANEHTLSHVDEKLTFDVRFPQEDRYICDIFADGTRVEQIEVYALEDDLFHLSPYKGDNHIHTYMSDGRESPAYMAASACNRGLDYCLITDHHKYEPSVQAAEFYAGTGVDFLIIHGEEVHSPGNPVHIINFGGTSSVNDWYRENPEEYDKAVAEEMNNITDPMTDTDRYTAAASQVIFDRIKSVGGLAILCHPHWICPEVFNETEDITDYLFEHRRFDVLELIAGGAYEVGTQMQVSYYHDKETIPVVGSSDAHSAFGGGLNPINYTIVFADTLTDESIKTALKSGLSVGGNQNKLYGDYRLVKYAYFLLKNFYPEHDEIRGNIGRLMMQLACGADKTNAKYLEVFSKIRPSDRFSELRYH